MFFLGGVFKVEDLTGLEWGVSILIGLGSLPVALASKLIVRCAMRCRRLPAAAPPPAAAQPPAAARACCLRPRPALLRHELAS